MKSRRDSQQRSNSCSVHPSVWEEEVVRAASTAAGTTAAATEVGLGAGTGAGMEA